LQLPIGVEEYILNKALKDLNSIKDKDLILATKQVINAKDYGRIVCKLNKALYGLKEVSRQWRLYLTSILEKLGFISLKIDNSVFINKENSIILATHVDDILVFAKHIKLVDNLYRYLSRISKLDIPNLGEIKEFLGVEIIGNRSKRSITITERSFISKILTRVAQKE
jgi:hypothetical protein